MKKKMVCFLIVLCIVQGLSAQTNTKLDSLILVGKGRMQEAVDMWDVQKMMASRALFERLSGDSSASWLVHYYLGFADLKIFHYYFFREEKEMAKKYIEDGVAHLEKTIGQKEDFAEGYALLSSLLGNKISLNPMLGMSLGMRSGTLIGQAFSLEPENPRISLIAGQSAYYTPEMFGGGKDKAKQHLLKAIEYFQTFRPENPTYPSWGYDEAYTFLGMVQMDQDELDEAMSSFQKALEINPQNGQIQFQLLPQLEEKMQKEKK
jgi:tetratricopeptide (TPR) repeat protein